jgi:hypothetical protein
MWWDQIVIGLFSTCLFWCCVAQTCKNLDTEKGRCTVFKKYFLIKKFTWCVIYKKKLCYKWEASERRGKHNKIILSDQLCQFIILNCHLVTQQDFIALVAMKANFLGETVHEEGEDMGSTCHDGLRNFCISGPTLFRVGVLCFLRHLVEFLWDWILLPVFDSKFTYTQGISFKGPTWLGFPVVKWPGVPTFTAQFVLYRCLPCEPRDRAQVTQFWPPARWVSGR